MSDQPEYISLHIYLSARHEYYSYEHGFVLAEEEGRRVVEEPIVKVEEDGLGGTSLRRACSLSDLNKPNVSRRILPAPPNNGIFFLLFDSIRFILLASILKIIYVS